MLFLDARSAAEWNIATARDRMTADMFLSVKYGDRRARFAGDNRGGKSGRTRADHHHICLAVPGGRDCRNLTGRGIHGSDVACHECRYATTRYEQVSSVDGHKNSPLLKHQ